MNKHNARPTGAKLQPETAKEVVKEALAASVWLNPEDVVACVLYVKVVQCRKPPKKL